MNLKKKLHLAQQEVYYGQLINPQSPVYNIGGYAVLKGNLNTILLKDVVGGLSSVFDTYNFRYDFTEENPSFSICTPENIFLSELDFSSDPDSEKKAEKWMQEQMDTAFDLEKEKWFRYTLIKIAEDVHWWFGYCHHLIHDGFGFAIKVNYVIEEYDKRLRQEDIYEIVDYPFYFKEAKKSNDYLRSKHYEKDATYWKEKYNILPDSVINYKKRYNKKGGGRFSIIISESDRVLFSRLSKKTNANLSQFTIAALLLYFGKITNQKIFSFGIPVHNRASREERKTLGMFSSVLPFKGEYISDKMLSDFITEIKQTQRNDYRHRQYPISHLNRSLKLLSENRQQIFDIIVNYEPFPFPKSLSSGLHVAIKHLSTITDLEDPLSLRWCDYGEDSSLVLNIDFLQEYFDESEIELLVERLLFILRQFENGLTKPLKDISILPESEKNLLLNVFNNTDIEFSFDKTIVELFESQVLKTPDNIAVVYKNTTITYKELDDRSNQLAHYITNKYKEVNDLVGVFTQRNIDLIVSVLGILKAGKAYVPMDTNYPADRIEYIIKDSNLNLVITDSIANELLISTEDFKRVLLDKDCKAIENESIDKLGIVTTKDDVAYIIYTSGTTGKPKGVLVSHLGIVNIALSWKNLFEVDEYTCLLQLASYAFDVFVGDLCKSILFGGRMIICPDDSRYNLASLYELIKFHEITLFETTPALGVPLMDFIYENDLDHSWIKQVILGSDVCHIHDFRRLYKRFGNDIRITNSYGVTEATIDSSYYETENLASLSYLSNVPLGKPLHNMQFYILDASKNLVPKGIVGELYIGGLGLAKEYLNNTVLTQEKFVPNPFEKGDRLYKTGDLARWLPNDNIDFIGRGDSQVKVRGYRIELGEIENILFNHTTISNCCVLAKNDSKGNKRLVGYVVVEKNFKKENIENFLEDILPDYMVPRLWVALEEMPLTTNGKLDKKALPDPNLSDLITARYVAPRNDTEEQLAIIWQELLGVTQVGIHDNFFELGGHSLLVVQLISSLQKLGFYVTVKDVFSNPTIASVSGKVSLSSSIYQVPANGIEVTTDRIVPSMVPLLDFEQEDIDTVVSRIAGGVSNIQDMYPLSPLQEGIYFHYLISDKEQGDPYVLPHSLSFTDKEKRASFIEALQFVVNRHDVLRTCVLSEGLPKAVQVVLREVVLRIDNLEIDSSKDVLSELELLTDPSKQWMDVSKAPLLELKIVDDSKSDNYYLIILEHHLALDHVGMEKMISEIVLYLSGKESSLPTPVLYRDFIGHILHTQSINDSASYFKELLGGIDTPTYPFELSDVRGNGSGIKETSILLSKELSKELRNISVALGMSPAVLFHAAYGIVIGKCSNKEYAIFGSLFSGRLQGNLGAEDSLGLFINTLPFFVELKGNVSEYVAKVKKGLEELLSYEQTQLSNIQSWSGISNKVPLFSAVLNFRHSSPSSESEDNTLIDLGINILDSEERSNYPFFIDVDDFGDDFGLTAQIDGSIDPDRVLAFIQEALVQLLEALKTEEVLPVASLNVLSEGEEHQLLTVFNDTQMEYPLNKTMIDLFEEQVLKRSNHIAVVYEETSITYKELNEKSNRLAHYINNKYIKADGLVGICISRGVDMVISTLGVLKSGRAYVAIDTNYPSDRIEHIIQDSRLNVLITNSIDNEILGSYEDVQKILLDTELEAIEKESTDKLRIEISTEDLAYIIYTSGTTGKPKGVAVKHLGVFNVALSWKKSFELDKNTRLLQMASYAFDVFVGDLCKSLLSGGQMIICPYDVRLDLVELYKLIARHQITIFEITPSLGVPLMDFIYENELEYSWLKQVILGSDVFHAHDFKRLYERFDKGIRIINSYGVTEATIDSSYYEVDGLDSLAYSSTVPIGKPLHNMSFYILNSFGRLVPEGVIGELYIGGLGVAKEYLNNKELTKEKFIPNPFEEGKLMYRTGDLGKWLPDGNLEFIGRKDNQVNIRGYRIELGEIENVLSSLASVNQCCVLVKEGTNGTKSLIGYVVLNETLNKEKLQSELREVLPDYMTPTLWVELGEIPLTTNGKLDKKSLPIPNGSMLSTNEYVAPRNEIEQQLVAIWQELLEIEIIGIHDNFFELGGHSLLATRLVSIIRKELEIEVAIQSIFKFITIDEIACYLEHKEYNLKYKEKEYSINIEI